MKKIDIKMKRKIGIIASICLIVVGSIIPEKFSETIGGWLIIAGFILLIISLTMKQDRTKKTKKDIKNFKVKKGTLTRLVEQKKNLLESIEKIKEEKNLYEKEIGDVDELKKSKNEIEGKINELSKELEKLEKDKYDAEEVILKTLKFKSAVLDMDELKNTTKELTKKKEQLENDVDYLLQEKAILKDEIEKLEKKQFSFNTKVDKTMYSIDYVDILKDGYEFEKYFSMILENLGFESVNVTSSSGDFGIDVLGEKDGIKYGFQCKLYSENVGNKAVQEAFSGREHYNCNIAVVVTNNYFTPQAQKQAEETRVLLWDRDILIQKINQAKIDSGEK